MIRNSVPKLERRNLIFFLFIAHSSSETHGRIVDELAALFKEIWRKQNAHIASSDFRNAIGHYHTMFSGSDHQDSHEFLRILIDWMHLDLETLSPVCLLSFCNFHCFFFRENNFIFKFFWSNRKYLEGIWLLPIKRGLHSWRTKRVQFSDYFTDNLRVHWNASNVNAKVLRMTAFRI